MDKQKQIEEMARDFGNAQYRCYEDSPCCKECILKGDCIPYEYARVAYNAGYRKIPEKAVVLTREEYDKLQSLKDENIEERDIHFKNLCGYKDEIARLQKQVDELKERLHMIFALGFDYDGCDKAESLKGLIDELVKITQMDSKEFAEYYKGVEVE